VLAQDEKRELQYSQTTSADIGGENELEKCRNYGAHGERELSVQPSRSCCIRAVWMDATRLFNPYAAAASNHTLQLASVMLDFWISF
jgi:hypothetical protein